MRKANSVITIIMAVAWVFVAHFLVSRMNMSFVPFSSPESFGHGLIGTILVKLFIWFPPAWMLLSWLFNHFSTLFRALYVVISVCIIIWVISFIVRVFGLA